VEKVSRHRDLLFIPHISIPMASLTKTSFKTMNIDLSSQGAEVSDSGVSYQVWAPRATHLSVEITALQKPSRSLVLERAGGGYFRGLDPAGKAGDQYQFCLDGGRLLPDPASRWQPEGVHGPSMVIDHGAFKWTDRAWRRPAFRDLVIYELHVGAFTQVGTFRSAVEKLEHVRDLGANAIEIMPVAEFAGARNWGYDGVCLFAPSHNYGHPDDLRALVDAAHGHGLAVILDVVYNHFGPDGNYLHSYIGDYLDEETKTPWGGAIRYGDPAFRALREMVVSNPAYWMRDFHIDGFRLDATHAIFDESPRHILQELTASIHASGGYAIAEDCRNEARLTLPEAEGGYGLDAVWSDDFHHIVRVANTHEDEGYLGDFQGTLGEAVDTLRHGWLYRGQYARSVDGPRGTQCQQLPPEQFVYCTSNHDQTGNHALGERFAHRVHPTALRAAEALLCIVPYTPMILWARNGPPPHLFSSLLITTRNWAG
jgi:maltooligosyltrehalose trehalohydrolase